MKKIQQKKMEPYTNEQLKELLDECIDHLEYTGYGDSYERECAEELIEKINKYVRTE